MRLHVLRSALGDCTLGGLSSRVASATCYKDKATAMEARERGERDFFYLDTCTGITAAYPDTALDGEWHMFGGNWLHSCDGRFNSGPIKVMDRVEHELPRVED